MNKDPVPYLKDIIESIEKIELYIEKTTEKSFSLDTQNQDAIIRKSKILK